MYNSRPPFAVRRPGSTAIVNKTKRSQIKPNKSKTARQKSKSKSGLNERINGIETRVNALEKAVESIINLTVSNEISRNGFEGQIITPRFSDSDNYTDTNGNTGISQYFTTAVEPPTNEMLLMEAVKRGDYKSTKMLIDERGANPNIRDENNYSLPFIAYLNTIENKDPQEYNKIVRYLLGLRTLDPEIRKEYTEFVKVYNKKHRKLGGKTKKRKSK